MNIVIPPHTGEGAVNQRPALTRTTNPTRPITHVNSGQGERQEPDTSSEQLQRGAIQGREGSQGREQHEARTTSFTDGLSNLRSELGDAEMRQLQALRNRDREVRTHEQAHAAAAGSLANGTAGYTYQRGPDGRLYAVGGEVKIDTAPIPGDPQATVNKARRIQQAALAPAQPSSRDRAIAINAAAMETRARAEIAAQKVEQNRQQPSTGEGSATAMQGEVADNHNAMVEQRLSYRLSYADHLQPGILERTGSLLDLSV